MITKLAIIPFLLITTLNAHGLNAPIRRHKVIEHIKKKQDTALYCLQETHFKFEEILRLKVKKKKMEKYMPY